MTSFNSGAQPQNRAPQSIGFLLLDNFTLISLASAVEPLRMANQLSGRELYRWTTLTVDGGQVWASDGLQITPDASMHKAPALDTVIVCGGVGIQRTVTREHVSWLQSQARQSRRLGAVCTGSWALACAGLLDGTGRPVGVLSVKRIVHYLVEHFPRTIYTLPPEPNAFPQEAEGA